MLHANEGGIGVNLHPELPSLLGAVHGPAATTFPEVVVQYVSTPVPLDNRFNHRLHLGGGALDPDSAKIWQNLAEIWQNPDPTRKKFTRVPIRPPASFKQDPATPTTAILDSLGCKKSKIALVGVAHRGTCSETSGSLTPARQI
jgi:hypothetical protein